MLWELELGRLRMALQLGWMLWEAKLKLQDAWLPGVPAMVWEVELQPSLA